MKKIANFIGFGIALALVCGCAQQTPKVVASAAAIPEVTAVARPKGYVMVREYVDSVKTDHGDEYQKVQYGWDYDQGLAVQRISDMDGKLISAQAEPDLTLETTPNELAYAFELVRLQPELSAIAKRPDARIYGGFSLKTDPRDVSTTPANAACGAKSRCIHVIISGGLTGEESLAHAIVNLASGLVVDANYRGELAVVSKIK